MNLLRYDYTAQRDLHYFVFESDGRNGKIKKVVHYSEMNIKGYFNLGFGD